MRPLGILLGMVVFDFWLHLGEMLGQELIYFPSRTAYMAWWITYWGIATALILAELKLMSKKTQ